MEEGAAAADEGVTIAEAAAGALLLLGAGFNVAPFGSAAAFAVAGAVRAARAPAVALPFVGAGAGGTGGGGGGAAFAAGCFSIDAADDAAVLAPGGAGGTDFGGAECFGGTVAGGGLDVPAGLALIGAGAAGG